METKNQPEGNPPKKHEPQGIDIYAFTRKLYELESAVVQDRDKDRRGVGEIVTEDIFATAQMLSEDEQEKLNQPEEESEFRRGVGKIETEDIFATAQILSEEEQEALNKPEPKSKFRRGVGEIETEDIFATARRAFEAPLEDESLTGEHDPEEKSGLFKRIFGKFGSKE